MNKVQPPTSGQHLGRIPGTLPFHANARSGGVLGRLERPNVGLLNPGVFAVMVAGPANPEAAAVHAFDTTAIPPAVRPFRLDIVSDRRVRSCCSGGQDEAGV